MDGKEENDRWGDGEKEYKRIMKNDWLVDEKNGKKEKKKKRNRKKKI